MYWRTISVVPSGSVQNRSFVTLTWKDLQRTKSVVRSSEFQECRGVQNKPFGALTRKDLQSYNIGRSEL
jgi:hypothetical protein